MSTQTTSRPATQETIRETDGAHGMFDGVDLRQLAEHIPTPFHAYSASAIRQRALSVPWVCWLTPMPQKMIERSEVA